MKPLIFSFILILTAALIFSAGCAKTTNDNTTIINNSINNTNNSSYVSQNIKTTNLSYWKSYTDNGKDLCFVDGKPVIRLFSTTWCPHCKWVKSTFDKVAKEYVDAGKIVAYHWELDTNDNTLTEAVETSIPSDEKAYFSSNNPQGYVPFYVFGCKYTRIGNNYENTINGTVLEEQEFRELIENLVASQSK